MWLRDFGPSESETIKVKYKHKVEDETFGRLVRWIRECQVIQLFGNLFCRWGTKPQRNFIIPFCLNTRRYDRNRKIKQKQNKTKQKAFRVVQTVSSLRTFHEAPLLYLSFSLKPLSRSKLIWNWSARKHVFERKKQANWLSLKTTEGIKLLTP